MRRIPLLVLTLVVTLPMSAAHAGLKVGDQAPEISITKWIQGEPVALAKCRDNKLVVVEFWATWCGPCVRSIPHLSDLQKKYENDVVIVGVTKNGRNNSLSRVEAFVNERKNQMTYTVAFDGDGATYRNYMTASGERGIPASFLIDKSGKLVWKGHPARLERALKSVLQGKLDSDIEDICSLLRKRIARKWSAGETEAELRSLTALHALTPEDKTLLLRKFRLENKLKHWDAAASTAKTIAATCQKNASMLNNVAWELLTQDGLKGKYNELALQAAVRCNELTQKGRSEYLDTLALAKFSNSAKKEAVEVQRRAVELARLAEVDAKLLAGFEERLKEFEAAAGIESDAKTDPGGE